MNIVSMHKFALRLTVAHWAMTLCSKVLRASLRSGHYAHVEENCGDNYHLELLEWDSSGLMLN